MRIPDRHLPVPPPAHEQWPWSRSKGQVINVETVDGAAADGLSMDVNEGIKGLLGSPNIIPVLLLAYEKVDHVPKGHLPVSVNVHFGKRKGYSRDRGVRRQGLGELVVVEHAVLRPKCALQRQQRVVW